MVKQYWCCSITSYLLVSWLQYFSLLSILLLL